MAHKVETMAYAGQKPWHGLGKEIGEDYRQNLPALLEMAGLNWTVRLEPLQLVADGRRVDSVATVRESDGSILGVVGSKFRPVQNVDAMAWFQPFLDAGAKIETAGSLDGGKRVWALANLSDTDLEITEGDTIRQYALLAHGHDGTLAIRAGLTPVRVVCNNTLSAAVNESDSRLAKIRHTASAQVSLDLVRSSILEARKTFEAAAESYRILAQTYCKPADLDTYVTAVMAPADAIAESLSTKAQNVVDRVKQLTYDGTGNALKGAKGTWWGAYNGITHYITHEAGHNRDSRLGSLWFGTNAARNRKALELAVAFTK